MPPTIKAATAKPTVLCVSVANNFYPSATTFRLHDRIGYITPLYVTLCQTIDVAYVLRCFSDSFASISRLPLFGIQTNFDTVQFCTPRTVISSRSHKTHSGLWPNSGIDVGISSIRATKDSCSAKAHRIFRSAVSYSLAMIANLAVSPLNPHTAILTVHGIPHTYL